MVLVYYFEPCRLLMGMMIELSPHHLVVPLPTVFRIRGTVNPYYTLSASYKILKSCFLGFIKNIPSGTHHDDHIVFGQTLLGEYRGIFCGIYLKSVFGSQLFKSTYTFRNRLMAESLGLTK